MSIQRWVDKSRFGSLRTYELSRDKTMLTVTCYHVLSYSMSYDPQGTLQSVDPNGGPYVAVGSTYRNWIIKRIISHHKKQSVAVFVLEVEHEKSSDIG
jgi:hypothetical protein